MTKVDEERGANREKIKRVAILIVSVLLAAAGSYREGRLDGAATATVPAEVKLVLDGPIQCALTGKLPVDVTGKIGLEVIEKKVKP